MVDFCGVLKDITKKVFGFVPINAGYIVDAEKTVGALQEAMRRLAEKRDDISEWDARMANHQGKAWLRRVRMLQEEADAVTRQFSEGVGCIGREYNYCLLHVIGKKATEALGKVSKLKEEGQELEDLYRSSGNSLLQTLVPQEVQCNAGASTMDLYMLEVLQFLSDKSSSNNGRLGILGMGGIGKTTLLEKVNNYCVTNGLFDTLLFIVATKVCDVKKIQKDMVSYLNLPTKEGEYLQARVIFDYLKERNFILLLDDLWEKIELKDIGIPLPLGEFGGYRRRLIITTRSEYVCKNMECHKTVKVNPCSKVEAWRLFKDKVGEETINSHPMICQLAEKVVDECKGLPLAIVAIGRVMSNKKDVADWEDAIEMLNKSHLPDIPGAEDDTFRLLKFSYDYLKDDVMRECFLLCSLWPEDYYISKDELIECWMGLGKINKFANISEAYRVGSMIIDNLQAASLLEHVDDFKQTYSSKKYMPSNYVKMHDVIRDMAHWIASNDAKQENRWLICSGKELTVAPRDSEQWIEVKRASLMHSNISIWDADIYAPNLSMLMLQQNNLLPQTVFTTIQRSSELTYLDLSHTPIKDFPLEICSLVNLEHLNLSWTKIISVPMELVLLIHLKYLYLRGLPTLKSIPSGLIRKLSNLRVLDLFCQSANPMDDISYMKALLEDLEVMDGHLKMVGLNFDKISEIEMLRKLRNTSVRYLYLFRLDQLDVLSFSSRQFRGCQALKDVKELVIGCSESLSEIVISEGPQAKNESVFRDLKLLAMSSLPKLETITCSANAMLNIRILNISTCKRLLHVSCVQHLAYLESLRIQWCYQMKMIVQSSEYTEGTTAEAVVCFPRLKVLRLISLANLRCISDCTFTAPELRRLEILHCNRFSKILFKPQSNQSAVKLCCQERKWESWDGVKSHFIPEFMF